MKFKSNVCINFIVFFTIFLLSQNIVQTINLSAIQKDNYSKVSQGGTTEFTILFWNVENSPFPINLKVTQAPENMVIIIKPNEFILNSSESIESSDIEYISTQNGIIKTFRVRVIVKIPEGMELGEHDIIISATAGEPKTGVSTLLEKKFKFTVDVVHPSFFESTTTIKGITTTQPTEGNVLQGVTGMVTSGYLTDFMLLIISIIALAFVIWFVRFRK